MDEAAELRDILTSDGSDESPETAPEPLDGAPPEPEDADESPEESEPLTAEERVAALLREEGGEPTDEEEDEEEDAAESADEASADDAGESDEDLEALLEEGRRARAARAQAEAMAPYQHLYAEAEQRVTSAKAHYAAERRRIARAVYTDARQAHDPDAYIAQHLDAAIDGVIAAEEAWIGHIGSDARARVQQIREEQARPQWAAYLAAERHLPKEAIPRILSVSDPRQMPAIADMLVEARNALANERRKRTRAERERAARAISLNQVHPGSTGRGSGAKPVELLGTQDELVAILNMK